jgi:hypothetical protein
MHLCYKQLWHSTNEDAKKRLIEADLISSVFVKNASCRHLPRLTQYERVHLIAQASQRAQP